MDEGVNVIKLTEVNDGYKQDIFINKSHIVSIKSTFVWVYANEMEVTGDIIDIGNASTVETTTSAFNVIESPEEIIKLIEGNNA